MMIMLEHGTRYLDHRLKVGMSYVTREKRARETRPLPMLENFAYWKDKNLIKYHQCKI